MTGQEMIDSFKQYYDRITNFSAPGYEDPEILLFINNAQDEFVKDRTFGKRFQPPALEDNQKRVADLRPLLNNVTRTVTTGPAGLYSITGPTNYLYYISSMANVTRTNPPITAEYVECTYIKTEDWSKFKQSAVNVTHHINPAVFSEGLTDKLIYVQVDSHTTDVANVLLSYVEHPTAIGTGTAEVDMSLEPHTHQEIVNIAVRHGLQVQQDPRYQSQVTEQTIKSE